MSNTTVFVGVKMLIRFCPRTIDAGAEVMGNPPHLNLKAKRCLHVHDRITEDGKIV